MKTANDGGPPSRIETLEMTRNAGVVVVNMARPRRPQLDSGLLQRCCFACHSDNQTTIDG